MIRVAAEVEDVPLGDAQVFQELPGGVRGATRLATLGRARELAQGLEQGEVRVPSG